MNYENAILHGGDIVSASRRYGIAIDDWVDLSTGINPEPYPIDNLLIDQQSILNGMQRLPYLQSEFLQASARYYQSKDFIATAGTQSIIQQLPLVLDSLPVLLPAVGYQEHACHWQKSGLPISYYPSMNHDEACDFIEKSLNNNNQQHIVIINPNNPTGILFKPERLYRWAEQLAPNAYLIIDEAFIDVIPQYSVLNHANDKKIQRSNIVVLRSFGKFFGLAGLRLGYCFSHHSLLEKLQQAVGLWQVNGVAQYIATNALNDTSWHSRAITYIETLKHDTLQIIASMINQLNAQLLPNVFLTQSPSLFLSYIMPSTTAVAVYEEFAQQGILLRVIPINGQQALLRVGLIGANNAQKKQLAESISRYV